MDLWIHDGPPLHKDHQGMSRFKCLSSIQNRQCNQVCQLFPRNALQNCYMDHLLPFSRWIQSCQIQGNGKTITMQRPSWMYTSGHTMQKNIILTSKQRPFWRRNDVIIASRAPLGKNALMYAYKKKTIWSFWYWDSNIPRWKFHTNVAHCKHHQVIIRHIHDNVG